MIREEVETLVNFNKSTASPVNITCSMGNIKISRIVRHWKERRNLKECLIFLCQTDARDNPLELRWEIESNRWFLEKI